MPTTLSAARCRRTAFAVRERLMNNRTCPETGTETTLACVDAVGGNLYFIDTAKREEQPHEILRRILGGLLHDVPDGIGDGCVERYTFDLHAGEIDVDELAWLERGFHGQFDSLACRFSCPSATGCESLAGSQEWKFRGGNPMWESECAEGQNRTAYAGLFRAALYR
jgi:hypothetical protein